MRLKKSRRGSNENERQDIPPTTRPTNRAARSRDLGRRRRACAGTARRAAHTTLLSRVARRRGIHCCTWRRRARRSAPAPRGSESMTRGARECTRSQSHGNHTVITSRCIRSATASATWRCLSRYVSRRCCSARRGSGSRIIRSSDTPRCVIMA